MLVTFLEYSRSYYNTTPAQKFQIVIILVMELTACSIYCVSNRFLLEVLPLRVALGTGAPKSGPGGAEKDHEVNIQL